ncbi:MAG TPA: hypothetical protein VEA99_17940 [Gemmatimonadaceae bacterium]|nr:hypothetical protein [Gemmatimonadaceae bacterium]
MTSLGDWLDGRTPAPPPALRDRLREALRDDLHAPAAEAHARCLEAGERLLAQLLARGATARTAALDLLAADALVTYAFEAAAEQPESLAERADDAMRRLSTLPHAPAAAPTTNG